MEPTALIQAKFPVIVEQAPPAPPLLVAPGMELPASILQKLVALMAPAPLVAQ